MLRQFRADLHIHTCLSPCAELDMTPREIVRAAAAMGLDLIAVTDHNTAENVAAAQRAAADTGVAVLGGMEISSSEEVHVIALFSNRKDLERMQETVYGNLPEGENDERLYGHQVVVNEFDEVLDLNRRLLIAATGISLRDLIDLVAANGGLAIASHVDRESFSVISQLGFMPPGLGFDALEFSPRISGEDAAACFPELRRFPWVSASDAHHVADIGRRTVTFTMAEPTLPEIRQALRSAGGRSVCW